MNSTEQSSVEQSTEWRVWTIPNVVSMLRLAGVPVFLWLLLGPQEDGWAVALLVLSGLSDWLDGKLARWLNQTSKFGALLDPAADRLYILATLVAFLIRGIVPWWVVAALLLREVIVGGFLVLLRRRGFAPFEVTYLGKSATFVLMYAFPILLLAQDTSALAEFAHPVGYAFIIWGSALYLWSGMLYVIQGVRAFQVTSGHNVVAGGQNMTETMVEVVLREK